MLEMMQINKTLKRVKFLGFDMDSILDYVYGDCSDQAERKIDLALQKHENLQDEIIKLSLWVLLHGIQKKALLRRINSFSGDVIKDTLPVDSTQMDAAQKTIGSKKVTVSRRGTQSAACTAAK